MQFLVSCQNEVSFVVLHRLDLGELSMFWTLQQRNVLKDSGNVHTAQQTQADLKFASQFLLDIVISWALPEALCASSYFQWHFAFCVGEQRALEVRECRCETEQLDPNCYFQKSIVKVVKKAKEGKKTYGLPTLPCEYLFLACLRDIARLAFLWDFFWRESAMAHQVFGRLRCLVMLICFVFSM